MARPAKTTRATVNKLNRAIDELQSFIKADDVLDVVTAFELTELCAARNKVIEIRNAIQSEPEVL